MGLFLHTDLTEIEPIFSPKVRRLCIKPYPLHPKGCPNFNKSERCPPKIELFWNRFDKDHPVYVIINEFDLGNHVASLKQKHPEWSHRQLYCVLYWQGTARKQLKGKIQKAFKENQSKLKGYEETMCPEGMGVDVTESLKHIGIDLEWPARKIARQVAFLAKRKDN